MSSSLQTQDLRPPDRGLRLVFGNCYLVEVHLRAKTTGRDLPGKIKKIGDLGNDKYTRFVLWKTVRTAEPIPLNTFGRFQGKMAALRRSRRNTESGAIRAADRRSHYRQHGRSLTRSAPQNTPDRLFLESSPALSPRGTVSAPLKRARPERTHGAKGSPFPPPSRGPRAWVPPNRRHVPPAWSHFAPQVICRPVESLGDIFGRWRRCAGFRTRWRCGFGPGMAAFRALNGTPVRSDFRPIDDVTCRA